MEKAGSTVAQMEAGVMAILVIIKTTSMKENTRRHRPLNKRTEDLADENLKQNISGERPWHDRSGTSQLDEKSSTMGRRNKDSSSTKDGLTGSDYDGQTSE
jgi:hypothetical protein